MFGNEFKSNISEAYDTSYEGAYRETLKTGLFFNVGTYDLSSCYPQMITDFCLDLANLNENTGLKIDIKSRVDEKLQNTYYFKQNENTVLPKTVKKLLTLKDELKQKSKNSDEDKLRYSAIKGIVNSSYGVIGNRYFRLFSRSVAETITFLVRDLLKFVRDEVSKSGYEILYIDTDNLMIQDNGINIVNQLNLFIKKWAKEKYNKISYIVFEYQGHFDRLLLLKLCHYYGYLNGKKEVKGLQVKRSSSSKYEAKFQDELINRVLNHETREKICDWIVLETERIKKLAILEVAFPSKINNDQYTNIPIFVRAARNSKNLFGLKINRGELFYYLFVESLGKDAEDKNIDVIAITPDFNFNGKKHLININWNEMIRRSIVSKVETIFEVMQWGNYNLLISGQTSLF